MRSSSIACFGALAMIALVWAPWGRLSLTILDTSSLDRREPLRRNRPHR